MTSHTTTDSAITALLDAARTYGELIQQRKILQTYLDQNLAALQLPDRDAPARVAWRAAQDHHDQNTIDLLTIERLLLTCGAVVGGCTVDQAAWKERR